MRNTIIRQIIIIFSARLSSSCMRRIYIYVLKNRECEEGSKAVRDEICIGRIEYRIIGMLNYQKNKVMYLNLILVIRMRIRRSS